MKFAYRMTLVDRASRKAENVRKVIETTTWIDYLKSDRDGIYGNSAEIIQEHISPLLETTNHEELFTVLWQFREQAQQRNMLAIFELAMYVWAGYKEGKYSADVWAVVLCLAWQSGTRGMLAAVELNQPLVLEFFRAAPRDILIEFGNREDDDNLKLYESIEDEIQLYRGVSTGIRHYEKGFSWTSNPEELLKFSALNCQNKKEIPGFVFATVKKAAILAIFSYESEFVIDPTVPKPSFKIEFLKGKALRQFRKNIDVEENTKDILFRTGYHEKLMQESAKAGPGASPFIGDETRRGKLLVEA